jgi:hypothetical protein
VLDLGEGFRALFYVVLLVVGYIAGNKLRRNVNNVGRLKEYYCKSRAYNIKWN